MFHTIDTQHIPTRERKNDRMRVRVNDGYFCFLRMCPEKNR